MKIGEWLAFFKGHEAKRLFSLADIVLLSGEGKASVSVQLSRLVRTGFIQRPVRGWYANPYAPPSAEKIAMVVRPPCYLSLESALARRNVLSQQPYALTLVTTKPPYTYRSAQSTLEYHQIKRSLFWGYTRQGLLLVAEAEKALLDLVYIRYVRGRNLTGDRLASLLDDSHLEELDPKKLRGYAENFDRTTKELLGEFLATF